MSEAIQNIPVAVWSGTFTLLGVTLKCHVLDTGQRIIDADSVALLFDALADPKAVIDHDELAEFARWRAGR